MPFAWVKPAEQQQQQQQQQKPKDSDFYLSVAMFMQPSLMP